MKGLSPQYKSSVRGITQILFPELQNPSERNASLVTMPESPSSRSNGMEPLLTPQGDNTGAPAQMTASPVMMEGSVEAATAHPLPTTPPLESQGGETYALVSPTSGRYPAPLSPAGVSFPAPAMHRSATDPFQNQVGESSSRPPSGGRSSRRFLPGVYDDGQHEADITDPASHGGERVQGPRPTISTRRANTVPVRNASVEDEKQALEWIVPSIGNGMVHRGMSMMERGLTVHERLEKTLTAAKAEKLKYETKGKRANLAVTAVTFAQLISNALITGLSAATTNRHAQIGVSALGAVNTIMSSFLLRLRSQQEPERSTTHAKHLERFCRELDAFMDDEGGSRDRKWDPEIKRFRDEFDRLQSAAHQSQSGQLVQTEGKPAAATPVTSPATTPGPTTPGLMNPGKMV